MRQSKYGISRNFITESNDKAVGMSFTVPYQQELKVQEGELWYLWARWLFNNPTLIPVTKVYLVIKSVYLIKLSNAYRVDLVVVTMAFECLRANMAYIYLRGAVFITQAVVTISQRSLSPDGYIM